MISKRAQSNLGIILIIAVIVIATVVFLKGTSAEGIISVRLYDINGKQLKTIDAGEAFSIVSGTEGVTDIDFTVSVQNTGEKELSCNIVSVSPLQFNSALTRTQKTVASGITTTWVSGKISVAQFESESQPVTFSADVTCSYDIAGTTRIVGPKRGQISLTILPDAEGDFTVSVGSGADGSGPVCGDGICDSGESSTSCSQDCAVGNLVNFRTSSPTYNSVSSIAYTNTCGNSLQKYGYSSATSTSTSCAAYDAQTGVNLLSNIPGNTAGGAKLFSVDSQPNNLIVCEDFSSSTVRRTYTLGLTAGRDAISTSPSSTNPSLEVAC